MPEANLGATSNRLLSLLTEEERTRLEPHLQFVTLNQGDLIFEAGEPARRVFFPESGVVSVVCTSAEGLSVEIGMVGCEGMAGLSVVLGDGETANRRAVMQVAGEGFLLDSDELRRELEQCGNFQRVLLRYAQGYLSFVAQSVFCQAFHGIDERLARWLIECGHRAKSDELHLTQEYVAEVIGVRRSGVTEALGRLKEKGLVGLARGAVTILDARGLEEASCECSRVIRSEFVRLFGT
jgi:CRP-like cAMP-binding protein